MQALAREIVSTKEVALKIAIIIVRLGQFVCSTTYKEDAPEVGYASQ
jgi:hypothetical protein